MKLINYGGLDRSCMVYNLVYDLFPHILLQVDIIEERRKHNVNIWSIFNQCIIILYFAIYIQHAYKSIQQCIYWLLRLFDSDLIVCDPQI